MKITKRQEEIVKSAGRILTEKGISGLTTKNLAKEMGFTESALYRHFESKENIIATMLEYITDQVGELYQKALNPEENPEENLKLLFRERLKFFANHPYFVVVVFSDGLMNDNMQIRQIILKMYSTIKEYLFPILEEGKKQNIFIQDFTTEELSDVLLGTFSIQMFKWRMADFGFNIREEGERFVEILLTLVKSK